MTSPMMNELLQLAGLLALLMYCYVKGQGTCTADPEEPSCVCTLPDQGDGAMMKIDLRSVGDSRGKPRFKISGADQYTYTYNPCYPYTDDTSGCSNVSVCQMNGTDGSARSVATQNNVTYSTVGTDIVISYIGGLDGRTALVTLQCGTSDILSFNGELANLKYTFTLTSQCACPGKCDKNGPINGKSGEGIDAGLVGIVLLSVFFLTIVVYFVMGMIIMRVKYNKSGSDVIPNKTFWFSLPSLVKDGVLFTISPCTSCKKVKKGYSDF